MALDYPYGTNTQQILQLQSGTGEQQIKAMKIKCPLCNKHHGQLRHEQKQL